MLESRGAIGGTWDLFRYPGVRSDSDMYTLGYGFKPWKGKKAIADGADIRAYIQETAAENGIDEHIRFHHKLVRADWSSRGRPGGLSPPSAPRRRRSPRRLTCELPVLDAAATTATTRASPPTSRASSDFKGQVVHPQHWPEDLDYAGKRVVVIGSGATAVTLIPSMLAKDAGHVTMLQRSPTYIISQPTTDPVAEQMMQAGCRRRTRLEGWSAARYLAQMQSASTSSASVAPRSRACCCASCSSASCPTTSTSTTHFKPRYEPWDQRLCLVPSGDLFKALRQHKVDMVTDQHRDVHRDRASC